VTDLEAALAAGGKAEETDLDRAMKAGGKVSHDVDAGPEARHERSIFGRPKMPEPKTDEELGIAGGPLFGDISGSPTRTQLAKNAPGTDAYAARHAGDEMHDPIAQALTAGAMAAPLAAVAGGAAPAALAPLVSGAVSGGQQAAMFGQNPITGALLGAIPGVPAAAGAADRALGAAALTRATSPGFGTGPGLPAKLLGKGVGMAVGSTHGPVGLLVGHDLGGRAANLFSKAGDAATSALARRYVSQELSGAVSGAPMVDLQAARNTFQLPEFGAPRANGFSASSPTVPQPAPLPPRRPLAPLVAEPWKPPTEVPPGMFGTPFLDEISGQPITQTGQGGFLPGEAATAVGPKPRRLSIQDESGRDLLAAPAESPSLRADTVRDARKFLGEPYSTEPSYQGYVSPEESQAARPRVLYPNNKGASLGPTGKVTASRWRGVGEGPDAPEPTGIADQLANSVRILSELRSAKLAGKLTPQQIQDAVKAGMSPPAVAKVAGREAFDAAMRE
jgi:hypothetical protein